MTYLKPYWTTRHNHISLDSPQYNRLLGLWLVKEWETQIHVNNLARRYKAGYIIRINKRQIDGITRLFESIGYRFLDWEIIKTQVWTALIFDHNI